MTFAPSAFPVGGASLFKSETMALYSIRNYTGTGDLLTLEVPPYIDKSHITVKVDGLDRDFTWVTPTTIKVGAGVGRPIVIRRFTSPGARLVDYQNGSVLTMEDLDTDSTQHFYLLQEIADAQALAAAAAPAPGPAPAPAPTPSAPSTYNNLVQSFTATAGQTTFTLDFTYTVGASALAVYVNGVRQSPTAYTESSPNTFTLSAGAPSGASVLAVSGVEVSAAIPSTLVSHGGGTAKAALDALVAQQSSLLTSLQSLSRQVLALGSGTGTSPVPSPAPAPAPAPSVPGPAGAMVFPASTVTQGTTGGLLNFSLNAATQTATYDINGSGYGEVRWDHAFGQNVINVNTPYSVVYASDGSGPDRMRMFALSPDVISPLPDSALKMAKLTTGTAVDRDNFDLQIQSYSMTPAGGIDHHVKYKIYQADLAQIQYTLTHTGPFSTATHAKYTTSGSYHIVNNFWGMNYDVSHSPFTQEVGISAPQADGSVNVALRWSISVPNTGSITQEVAIYPEVVYGKASGMAVTPGAKLPALVNKITSLVTSYDQLVQATEMGQVTYDLWTSSTAAMAVPDRRCEIMLASTFWGGYGAPAPWEAAGAGRTAGNFGTTTGRNPGIYVGRETIDGKQYDLYHALPNSTYWSNAWAFVVLVPMVFDHEASNVNWVPILKNLVNRGWISGTDYLAGIEVGIEAAGKGRKLIQGQCKLTNFKVTCAVAP